MRQTKSPRLLRLSQRVKVNSAMRGAEACFTLDACCVKRCVQDALRQNALRLRYVTRSVSATGQTFLRWCDFHLSGASHESHLSRLYVPLLWCPNFRDPGVNWVPVMEQLGTRVVPTEKRK